MTAVVKNDAGSIRNLGRDLAGSLSESDLQREVIAYARARGWLVAHFRPAKTPSGRFATHMQGHRGFPDLVLARKGRVLFWELKAQRGTVTPEQQAWLASLGGQVMRPEQWFDGTIEKELA